MNPMIAMIFFGVLVTVMIITVVVANSVLRKRDVDQMKTLVSGRVTQMGEKGETPLMEAKDREQAGSGSAIFPRVQPHGKTSELHRNRRVLTGIPRARSICPCCSG